MRGLLDTSVFIATEQRRTLREELLPEEAAISVITLAELNLGVHLASSEGARAQRLATVSGVRAAYVPLPVDERVAASFAELVAGARRSGRRAKVQDAWIAATAHAHGVAVYTQDSDFDAFASVEVVRV